jgi:hypothetical protein
MNRDEILEYRLPDYLTHYLINGEKENLTEKEVDEIDHFLKKNGVTIIEKLEDSGFYWSNDLNNIGAYCSTFLAQKF